MLLEKIENGNSKSNFCLSLCKYSKDKIINIIENQIKEDNEKYLKELLGE